MRTLLLFASFTLSINAFPQCNQPQFNLNRTTSSSRQIEGNVGNQPSGIDSRIISGQAIKHQTCEQRSFIQLYDSVYFWVWDPFSIGWHIDQKITGIVYDANNNLTSEIYQKWNGSTWINSTCYTNTYDNNNNLTHELRQQWSDNTWENTRQLTYTYDANNNQTSELGQDWDGSIWVNNWQNTYTYDANNNQTSELNLFFYDGIWHNSLKLTYTYDANNNLTCFLRQYWSGGIWLNSQKTIYTYDANNNLTSELHQQWMNIDDDWENDLLNTLTYDANNNCINVLLQGWIGNSWIIIEQHTYTYDANNNLINKLYQDWWDSVWWNLELYSYTYDINNNRTNELKQLWSGNDSAWENSEKKAYTYDADNNQTNELYQQWNGNSWLNYCNYTNTYDANKFVITDSYKEWYPVGIRVIEGDSTYYYFQTTVGIDDIIVRGESINIYPNPASTTITISLPTNTSHNNSTLSIYNVNSLQVISCLITEPITVLDIGTLPQGIYFMKLADERTVLVNKFIKL